MQHYVTHHAMHHVTHPVTHHGAPCGVFVSLLRPLQPLTGTVKFHFDMWGNGIAGAMSMEEMGATGCVHVSDATVAEHRTMHGHRLDTMHVITLQARYYGCRWRG